MNSDLEEKIQILAVASSHVVEKGGTTRVRVRRAAHKSALSRGLISVHASEKRIDEDDTPVVEIKTPTLSNPVSVSPSLRLLALSVLINDHDSAYGSVTAVDSALTEECASVVEIGAAKESEVANDSSDEKDPSTIRFSPALPVLPLAKLLYFSLLEQVCPRCRRFLVQLTKGMHSTKNPMIRFTKGEVASTKHECSFCKYLDSVVSKSASLRCIANASCETLQLEYCQSTTEQGVIWESLHLYLKPVISSRPKQDSCATILYLPSTVPGSGYTTGAHGRRVRPYLSIDLARSWLRVCQKTHLECNSKQYWSQMHFPMRLIDLHTRCLTMATVDRRYVCLSYVWGQTQKYALTTKSQESFFTNNSTLLTDFNDELPAAFKDAMRLAEQLGYRYLWIDALCILQDDPGDLSIQIENMNIIYQYSELTIVSTTSSPETGLFGGGTSRANLQSHLYLGSSGIVNKVSSFEEVLANSPWERRAWTLQEKFFSSRLLILSRSQAFFLCNTMLQSEDGAAEHSCPHIPCSTNIAYSSGKFHPTEHENEAKHIRQYRSLLKDYMRRDLSHKDDALRAFGGVLSSSIHSLGKHVWGLPRAIFSQAIVWRSIDHNYRNRNKEFPSWSWAGWRTDVGVEIDFLSVEMPGSPAKKIHPEIQWNFYEKQESGLYKTMRMAVSRKSNTISERSGCCYAQPAALKPSSYHTGSLGRKSVVSHNTANHNTVRARPSKSNFSYDLRFMPPLSHIVRFTTEYVSIRVSREFNYRHSEQQGKKQVSGVLYDVGPNQLFPITTIDLDPAWRSSAPEELPFIVVGHKIVRGRLRYVLMAIEWVDNVAYRVQICEDLVKQDDLYFLNPIMKDIALG